MENKELTVLDFNSNDVVKTLKETVAQGLTNSEFALFAEHCKSTKLNPFKKEVWAIKAGGRLQLMTGINGYFTIANSHPQYDGYEEGYIGKNGEELPDTYAGNDYQGAWCKVYRKDRRMPAKGVAFNAEYNKGHGNWKTMPRVMILKCAESIALRKAFPQELNGTYTAEEMPKEFNFDDKRPQVLEAQIEQGNIVIADELKPLSDEWTGELPVGGTGKHKDTPWKDLSDDSVFWYRDTCKNKSMQECGAKEIDRRMKAESEKFEDINNQAEEAGAY